MLELNLTISFQIYLPHFRQINQHSIFIFIGFCDSYKLYMYSHPDLDILIFKLAANLFYALYNI